jgi:hypothetical protein
MFAARNTPAARAFLTAWAVMLEDPGTEKDEGTRQYVEDQMALNLLFERGGIVGAGEGASRAALGYCSAVLDRASVLLAVPLIVYC